LHHGLAVTRFLRNRVLWCTTFRIETLAGVKRTIYNQYESLVLPLQSWLAAQAVQMISDCGVTHFDHRAQGGKWIVTGIQCLRHGLSAVVAVEDGDFVFVQGGSMTDASSLGSMTSAPAQLTKRDSAGWSLWEKLAYGQTEFGDPSASRR
jgi:oleate hydratase